MILVAKWIIVGDIFRMDSTIDICRQLLKPEDREEDIKGGGRIAVDSENCYILCNSQDFGAPPKEVVLEATSKYTFPEGMNGCNVWISKFNWIFDGIKDSKTRGPDFIIK